MLGKLFDSKKSFVLQTWGDNERELISYLKHNATSLQVIQINTKKTSTGRIYATVYGKCNKSDYKRLGSLGDIIFKQ